jgi:hypothetical protein
MPFPRYPISIRDAGWHQLQDYAVSKIVGHEVRGLLSLPFEEWCRQSRAAVDFPRAPSAALRVVNNETRRRLGEGKCRCCSLSGISLSGWAFCDCLSGHLADIKLAFKRYGSHTNIAVAWQYRWAERACLATNQHL